MRLIISLLVLFLLSFRALAAPLNYALAPQQIAPNTWLLQGKLEDFSNRNGGNIVNTAFVVTEQGVVVIDTGPSLRYGKALRAAIGQITDKPIVRVFNTHHHPDHFLGNQAFKDIAIISLPETGKQIAQQGNAFAENMYRMVGDWMRSTEVFLPTQPIDKPEFTLGSHTFELLSFSGHSGADLVILDRKTGVLFASDMVFYQRALTTPHTPGLDIWIKEIEKLRKIEFNLMVPGHGPVVTGFEALDQMAAYLKWLDQTLTHSAEAGLSMTEVINLPIKPEFKDIALTRNEFIRTVAHLYPSYEERAF